MNSAGQNLLNGRRLQALVIWSVFFLAIAALVIAVIFRGRYPASPYFIILMVALNLIPAKHWVYKGLINIGILLVVIGTMIIYNL